MSELDENLRFGPVTGNRPAATVAPVFLPCLFPQTLAPDWYDLRIVMDYARVRPVYANFHIITSFGGPGGSSTNVLRFAAWATTAPDVGTLLADSTSRIACSHDFSTAGLQTQTERGGLARTEGPALSLPLPPLGDLNRLVAEGRQFLMIGYEALVATADWNVGAIRAYLTQNPLPSRPLSYSAGR